MQDNERDNESGMNKPERIVVATTNAGKVREFASMLAALPIRINALAEFPYVEPPDETGTTFEENARIKAADYARQLGEWVIADDSGLEIAALGGAPGVHSARFAGIEMDYDQKMQAVLAGLKDVAKDKRGARFVSVIALADPAGDIAFSAEGICPGRIASQPSGINGFGYDPIFIPDGFDHTFGELTDAEKHSISHRGRAANEFIRQMLDFIGL